ncbi:MAG: 50S ribosomal protein L23 [Patescibacteria group bacterium]
MSLFGSKKTDQPAKAKTATAKPAVKPEKAKPAAASMQDLYSESVPAQSGQKSPAAFQPSLQTVLRQPVITEKATNQVEHNKYSFLVASGANKISIAAAVRALYGVKPTSVNIINRRGKQVTRGRIQGSRSDSKVAVVTLAKGETIKVYEGV